MHTFKRILSGVLAAAMTIGAASTISIGAANVSFTDVSGHWAWTNGQIPYLVEKGVLNGYEQSNGTYIFKPDGQVKRSEFIKMLDEVFGLTETTAINFNDVKSSDWFYPYFQKAAAQGYILNYGSSANPNGEITREEATALLVRYLNLPANVKVDASTLADYSTISDNFKEYVLRAVAAGIITGYNENGTTLFKPKKTLSRAEALTILYRAAGCIFDESAYSRDGSAPNENNTITGTDITINNVRFNGRNIITEGANNGKITFSDCDINGTLEIRGAANVTFDDCTVDDVIMYGGGSISVVSGSTVNTITLEVSSDIGIYSNTRVGELTVSYGADNVRVTGDGVLSKAVIRARGFSSSMLPTEFEIGNNLTASFASTQFQGSSDAQNAFAIAPFSTADEATYYLNMLSNEDGRVYYYYTNIAVEPTVSSFESYYNQANNYGSFEVRQGEPICAPTLEAATVKNFDYVALQLENGNRKYAPVLVANNGITDTGFKQEPYVYDETTIKFQPASGATLCWFYADDGKQLSQIEFLSTYENKESALKGETVVSSIKTFSCSLKEKYLKNYSYVAFMLKTGDGIYHTPVIVSIGDTGFEELPVVKTPGTITFRASVAGDLYYYYSETRDLPTADNFKSEYNAARYSDNDSFKRNAEDTIKYDLDHIDDYPYMILAIRNSDGDYMQPVCVEIDFTTGFETAPSVKNSTEIRFRTEEDGTVKYYYTKEATAPTIADFNTGYSDQSSKYRGSMNVNSMFETIEYNPSYAVSYPYLAIMFIDEDGKEYSPVLVGLDATRDTGFSIAPYAENGKIYFRTQEDGEVWYYYSKDSDPVAPDDFEDDWFDESSSRRGSFSVRAGDSESFSYNSDLIDKYPYIVLAFTEDINDSSPDFSFPFVLDVQRSEVSNVGSGLEISGPYSYGEISVEALFDGRLYWYRTDDKDDLPTSQSDFEKKYNAADSDDSGRISMKAGEDEDLEFKKCDYIVCALKVGDEFLNYVIVHYENGVESDGSGSDLDYDKDSYGFTLSVGKDCLYLTPSVDGTVQIFSYPKTDSGFSTNPVSVEKGEETELDLPAIFSSDFALSFLFNSTKLYVQLTDDNGNTYRPREIPLY